MPDIQLTKNAASLLKAMLKKFNGRKKGGLDSNTARIFGDALDIQREVVPKWSFADVEGACFELAEAGLLDIIAGDDSIELAILTTAGISYARSGAWATVQAIWKILREFLPFIPLGP